MDERKTKEIKSVESSISLDLTVEKRVSCLVPKCCSGCKTSSEVDRVVMSKEFRCPSRVDVVVSG